MRKTVLVALAVAAAGSAFADISTKMVQAPGNPNPNQQTYDLKITVSGGDNWTSTSMKASISGGNFYNEPLVGTNTQPIPAWFSLVPELEWDTFVTQPEGWPNTAGQGLAPGLVSPSFTPTTIDVTWFDNTSPNSGDGTFTIARVTLENLTPGWNSHFAGAHTTKKGLGTLFPYEFSIPEPGALSLLVLGSFSGLIRRR